MFADDDAISWQHGAMIGCFPERDLPVQYAKKRRRSGNEISIERITFDLKTILRLIEYCVQSMASQHTIKKIQIIRQ